MAKAKRRRESDKKVVKELYYRCSKIGLPEVDKLWEEQAIVDPARKSIKRRRIGTIGDTGGKEDRISRLPCGVLQFIISLLTIREGAATAILSRCWRNIWNSSISPLIFNNYNLFGSRYPKCKGVRKKWVFAERLRTNFIRRVNLILQSHRALRLDTLQITFPLFEDHATYIDRWLELAASQGVTNLQLDFRIPFDKYTFSFQRFGSSLNYLSISNCIIEFPRNLLSLNSLKCLNLTQCVLTNDDVQNILFNCPSLEWLSIYCCTFLGLTILKFVGPSIRLKHLHINACYNFKKIKVHDLNLLSFEWNILGEQKLSIKNVPHLAKLVLHMNRRVKIRDNIPCLETLILLQICDLPKLSVFSNLRQLVFASDYRKTNYFEVVRFLEACPLLQQLELGVHLYCKDLISESSKISMRPGCPHHNLREIRIYGFNGNPELIELARYLLRNAVVLEKMIIYKTFKSYSGNRMYVFSKVSPKLVGPSIEKVHDLLQREKRPSTMLLIESK